MNQLRFIAKYGYLTVHVYTGNIFYLCRNYELNLPKIE